MLSVEFVKVSVKYTCHTDLAKIILKGLTFFLRFDSPLLEEGALAVAVQGETLSSDFMTLCVWLVENLKNLCSVQESVSGK